MTTREQVSQEMTLLAVTIGPEESLHHAYQVMRRAGVRHLPVLNNSGAVVGILSDRDILRQGCLLRNSEEYLNSRQVSEAMSAGVHTCRAGDRLGDIADAMIHHEIDGLPVVDQDDRLVGIITSTDLLRYLRRTEGVIDEGAKLEPRYSAG